MNPYRTDDPGSGHMALAAEALEARVALRLTARLEASAQALPHDIQERLRVARQNALAHGRAAQRLTVVQAGGATARSTVISGGNKLALGGDGAESGRWGWLGMVLPVLVLLMGLFAIQEWHEREQISLAAEIDAALLGDDLPPAAYTDPGFLEFMRTTSTRAEP